MITAPLGPGLYELRSCKTSQLILFGRSDNVAHRMTSLLPPNKGGRGTRNNTLKQNYVARNLKHIQYRTKPCANHNQAVREENMLKQNSTEYRFPT